LADYALSDACVVHLVLKLRGHGGNLNKCIDVTDEGRPIVRSRNSKTPEWRVINTGGLCIEGKCKNQDCVAYKKTVVICKGYGIYDVVFDGQDNQCPMCYEKVKPRNYGFYDCNFRFIGTKSSGGWPKEKVRNREAF